MTNSFLAQEISHITKVLRNQCESIVLGNVVTGIGIVVHPKDMPLAVQFGQHQFCVASTAKCGIYKRTSLLSTDAESFEARRSEDWDVVSSGVHDSVFVGGFNVLADVFGERAEVKIFHVVQHIEVVSCFAPYFDFFAQAGHDDFIVVGQFNAGVLE